MTPILAVAVIVVAGARLLSGGDTAAAPDPTSAAYTADVLERTGTDPEQLVNDLIDGLLPIELTADERVDASSRLATALHTDSESPDDLADALIRRLGPAATDAATADELIGSLVDAIDPEDTVGTVDELITAVDEWASTTSPHILRLTTEPGAGVLAGFDQLGFDEATALLDGLDGDVQILELGFPAVEGLDAIDVPGVRWTSDPSTRTIVLVGGTDGLGTRAAAFAIARWSDDSTATVLGGLRVSDWQLADAGFTGELGRAALPSTTFLLAGDDATWSLATAGAEAWGLMAADLASGGALELSAGVHAITTIDGASLPDDARVLLAGGEARLDVRASLGDEFGVVDGTAVPTGAELSIAAPGLQPPALPSWISASGDVPWSLTLTHTEGEPLAIAIAGRLDVELDGARRPIDARVEVASGTDTDGRIVGRLAEPWVAPFGVGWLELGEVTMTLDPGDAAAARFDADVVVAGRDARLTLDLTSPATSGTVRMQVATDRLTAGDAVDLLVQATDASPPAAVPDLALDDVLLEVEVGNGTTVAIGGTTTIAGQRADALVGVETVSPTSSGVVMGFALDSWRLTDLVPAASGTLLDELEFPPSALVLSSLEGSVAPNELSEPARRFFADIETSGPLRLTPGVSLFGTLDLADTGLHQPLAALGFDDGRLPIVGTLPGSAIGIGEAGQGSPMRDLSLAVPLPEVASGGGPEWFRGGQLSLVATGTPSLGLEGEMVVQVDGEDLPFVVVAEFARQPTGIEVAVVGSLATERPWEAPFGVEWLTVHDARLALTVDPLGTVGLGFGGAVDIGDRAVDVAIATEITGGAPTNFAFEGASPDGLALSDLVAIQNRMAAGSGSPAVSLGAYPDLALRNATIRFAPQAFERLGIEAGFALAGDVWIGDDDPIRFAALDFRLSPDGLTATGALRSYDLGPIAWSDVDLDLALAQGDQHFRFDGDARLFGITAAASIDLSSDSVFFHGRDVLEDVHRAVDLFEQLVDDPVETLTRLDEIYAAADVPAPPWVADLLDVLDPLLDQGVPITADVVDTALNGGTIPLVAIPPGGTDPVCLVTTPIEAGDGRCYTTPPVPATSGVPSGGDAKACSRLAPNESGGRCYTILPKGKVCLASYEVGGVELGMVLRDGRCYAKVRRVTGGYRYLPSGGLAPTVDDGTPNDGASKICHVETPIDVDGRCYTVPPTPAIPGVPTGGVERACSFGTTEEQGRCWVVPPSVASRGLGAPGVCAVHPVSCRLDDLIRGDLARSLFDGVMARLD